ncbi:angiopoietin-4-like [Haliotis rubra]|uniref:angiopoietin-4-like n=1 Tax=Haliotis rubra TaxID=36100 RepID=UPI001EE623F6|nr:angiopoietin-4-like [Haliotis rubra]
MRLYFMPQGYHSSCHYHGFFLNDTSGCRCYGGYIGAWCERLMEDCTEGASTDHYRVFTESDVFKIHPKNSPLAFKVVCEMHKWPPGWTFFYKRRWDSPYVNFTRQWEDYKHGFGDFKIEGNFWSGLDMIYHVTNNRPHRLRAYITFQEDGVTIGRKYFYNDFQVNSETYGYNFSFSSAASPVATMIQLLMASHHFWEFDFRLTMSTTTTTAVTTVQVSTSLGFGSPHVTATIPQGSHNLHQFNTRRRTPLNCPGLTQ